MGAIVFRQVCVYVHAYICVYVPKGVVIIKITHFTEFIAIGPVLRADPLRVERSLIQILILIQISRHRKVSLFHPFNDF